MCACAGRRSYLAAELWNFAYELAVDDGEVMSHADAYDRLTQSLQYMKVVHHGLVHGNASMGLESSLGNNPDQVRADVEMQYATVCGG